MAKHKQHSWDFQRVQQQLTLLYDNGWAAVGLWSIGAVTTYGALYAASSALIPFNQGHEQRLHAVVAPLAYHLSAAAFLTAFTLSLVSFIFEDTPAKQQHAWLACLAKGMAAYTDVSLASSSTLVAVEGSSGAMWLPLHYISWGVALPTLLFSVSRTSDFRPREVAMVVGRHTAMVAALAVANCLPLLWALPLLGVSIGCMHLVLKDLHRMTVASIGNDAVSLPTKRCWRGVYWHFVAIWCLLPAAWLLNRLQPERGAAAAEAISKVTNFLAIATLTSSVVFGNYRTAAQRRLQTARALENEERVALVAQLTNAITQKDEFMSLMSHELRTPLNGIIQLSDFLLRGSCGELSDKATRFSGTIKNSGLQLLNIINDILDAAALKEGRLAIKHEHVTMGPIVQQVVDLVTPLARQGVIIEHVVHPRTPAIIGDAGRITQILYNLMGNALKFTHHGKVSLTVRPGSEPHYITMCVADTGIGIPKDKIALIFEAFEQVDMSVSRKYGGTGLGLKIVHSLVEAHRGTIQVTSELGKGTQFIVRLPVLQRGVRTSLEGDMQRTLRNQGYDYDDVADALSLNRSDAQAALVPRNSISIPRKGYSRGPSFDGVNPTTSRPSSLDRERGPPQRRSSLSMIFNPDGSSNATSRTSSSLSSVLSLGAASPAPLARMSTAGGSGGIGNGVMRGGSGLGANGVLGGVGNGSTRRLSPVPSNDGGDTSSESIPVYRNTSSIDCSSSRASIDLSPRPSPRPSALKGGRQSVEWAPRKTLISTKSM